MTPIKILVVEDEMIVALDLQRRLQRLGYQVPATATTGELAIQLAEQIDPDLICMDIGLKGNMDGIEAAQQIRKRRNTPIIFLTAFTDAPTRQRAQTLSPIACLTKPFEDEAVLNTVTVALATKK